MIGEKLVTSSKLVGGIGKKIGGDLKTSTKNQ